MSPRIDIARGRPATQSSVCDWSTFPEPEREAAIVNGATADPDRFCHTGWEPWPWWQVEFDGAYDLHHVRVRNRRGVEQRLKRFSLLGSLDGEIWRELHRKSDGAEFHVYDAAIVDARPARWLRLRLDGVEFLHISQCEVFGERSDAKRAGELLAEDAQLAKRRRAPPAGKSGHVVKIAGFNIFVDDAYGRAARESLNGGDYEARERNAVLRQLRPTDRVLELGTAVGVMAMTAASVVGEDRVATFDADPAMVAAARDNFARNGFGRIRAELGVLANRSRFQPGVSARFHVARDFWGSSLTMGAYGDEVVATIETPTRCLEDELRRHDANVIICDIEGGEVALFDGADLAVIRLIVMETHYGRMGEAATDAMVRSLILQGFSLDLAESGQQVVILRR
ncbi:MAG: FkbM family methyltransferase [Bradyrhizobium sp.]|nr:MAG: FkbM family methyltransferase [Bradyrhizobium sp.]